jgi:hypothetical protein
MLHLTHGSFLAPTLCDIRKQAASDQGDTFIDAAYYTANSWMILDVCPACRAAMNTDTEE